MVQIRGLNQHNHCTLTLYPLVFCRGISLSFAVQHRAATVGGAAPAGEVLLDPGCLADIDHQTVIVREFLADFDIALGIKKDAVAILTGFQIWFTRVINPLGGVASVLGVDDVAIVQMKIESVVGLACVVRVAGFSFLPCDDLALVLQHLIAGLDGTDGVDALAVNARFAHLDAATAVRYPGSGIGRLGGCLKFFLSFHNESQFSEVKRVT